MEVLGILNRLDASLSGIPVISVNRCFNISFVNLGSFPSFGLPMVLHLIHESNKGNYQKQKNAMISEALEFRG